MGLFGKKSSKDQTTHQTKGPIKSYDHDEVMHRFYEPRIGEGIVDIVKSVVSRVYAGMLAIGFTFIFTGIILTVAPVVPSLLALAIGIVLSIPATLGAYKLTVVVAPMLIKKGASKIKNLIGRAISKIRGSGKCKRSEVVDSVHSAHDNEIIQDGALPNIAPEIKDPTDAVPSYEHIGDDSNLDAGSDSIPDKHVRLDDKDNDSASKMDAMGDDLMSQQIPDDALPDQNHDDTGSHVPHTISNVSMNIGSNRERIKE